MIELAVLALSFAAINILNQHYVPKLNARKTLANEALRALKKSQSRHEARPLEHIAIDFEDYDYSLAMKLKKHGKFEVSIKPHRDHGFVKKGQQQYKIPCEHCVEDSVFWEADRRKLILLVKKFRDKINF